MSWSLPAVLGVAATLLSLVDPIPYLRDVARGRTTPHRVTWGIWSTVGVVALCAQVAHGVDWSLGLLVVQSASMLLTFGLSFARGVGGATAADVVALGLAAAGIVAWVTCDDPVLAVLGAIAADVVAFAVMLPKAWRDPWSETWSSFLLAGIAGGCSALAVGGLDPNVLYPGYFFLVNVGFALMVLVRRSSPSRPVRQPVGELRPRQDLVVQLVGAAPAKGADDVAR